VELLPDAVARDVFHTTGRVFSTEESVLAADRSVAQLHQDWLKSLPELTGKPLSRIADELGIARTTLTKKAKAKHANGTLNAATIDKIVNFHRVAGPGGHPTPIGVPARSFAEDAAPYEAQSGNSSLERALVSLIAGRKGIDPWTLKTRALEGAGFLPGDIVLVDLNASPRPGEAVCAQVYDWAKMKAETVMRVYQPAGGVELLLAHSTDPAFAEPLVVDGERVAIKGVLLPHRLRQP